MAEKATTALNLIRAVPYFANGQQRGYRLYPTTDPARFEAIGLQPGDLLLEVEDRPINHREALPFFYERLDSGESVTAKIMREDAIYTVWLELN